GLPQEARTRLSDAGPLRRRSADRVPHREEEADGGDGHAGEAAEEGRPEPGVDDGAARDGETDEEGRRSGARVGGACGGSPADALPARPESARSLSVARRSDDDDPRARDPRRPRRAPGVEPDPRLLAV